MESSRDCDEISDEFGSPLESPIKEANEIETEEYTISPVRESDGADISSSSSGSAFDIGLEANQTFPRRSSSSPDTQYDSVLAFMQTPFWNGKELDLSWILPTCGRSGNEVPVRGPVGILSGRAQQEMTEDFPESSSDSAWSPSHENSFHGYFSNNQNQPTARSSRSNFKSPQRPSFNISRRREPTFSNSYQLTAIPPTLHVLPLRIINFTNFHIQFSIQVLNLSAEINIAPIMFDAVAETPSGIMIPCQICKGDYFYARSFTGNFRTTSEAGIYHLRVRLVLPFQAGHFDSNIIYHMASIQVSRNYFRDSTRMGNTFQVYYQPLEEPTTVKYGYASHITKVWGLTCFKLRNHLYYTDRASHKITCLDAEGNIVHQFGPHTSAGKLNRPTGICCDEFNRRIIVADKDNHRICFFTLDGTFISAFGFRGHDSGLFGFPWDVAASPDGTRIAVADSRNRRVQIFDRLGNFIDKFSVFETNPFDYKDKFDYPRGISFDNDGKLIYVTDFNVQNIHRLPVDLQMGRKLVPDGKLCRPQGIAVDSSGSLLVADSKNNIIRHINSEGQLLSTIRAIKGEAINYPVNVTTMAGDGLAVLDGRAKIHIL